MKTKSIVFYCFKRYRATRLMILRRGI